MNFEKLGKFLISFFTSPIIIDKFPDTIIITDSSGVIKNANKKAYECFGDIDNITINELFADGAMALKDSAKYKKSIIVQKRNNEKEYYELNVSKISKYYCVSVRDNTKIINEYLQKDGIERFNNEKNAMLYKLENDIKAPINSISGFAQGLVDGIGGQVTEKQDKYLKIILNNINELSEFTDKFLDFSYAESLLYDSEYKNFDIITEIKKILKDFEAKNERISTDFDYSTINTRNVYTDLKAFKKALECILEVSSSLTENGRIFLRLSYPNDESFLMYGLAENNKYLQLLIQDTGACIPQEDMQYICNPYAKIEKGRKIFVRSLRLGTASILVKRIDGIFNFSSETIQGNLYNIIIPVTKEENE